MRVKHLCTVHGATDASLLLLLKAFKTQTIERAILKAKEIENVKCNMPTLKHYITS